MFAFFGNSLPKNAAAEIDEWLNTLVREEDGGRDYGRVTMGELESEIRREEGGPLALEALKELQKRAKKAKAFSIDIKLNQTKGS